jgi:hypothetical protein
MFRVAKSQNRIDKAHLKHLFLQTGRAILVLVSANIFGTTLKAQILDPDPEYYSFHPMSIMALGVGFSPNNVGQMKLPGIEYEKEDVENGGLATDLKTYLVSNSSQLKEALGVDVKIDASYLVYKGSGEFSLSGSKENSSDSITFVVTASTEFGRVMMKHPQLSDAARALIQDGRRFEAIYGSRYVAMERRGASVSAIVTILGVAPSTHDSITADMSGSGGWGPLSASASSKINLELEQANKGHRVTIVVHTTGGKGMGALGDILKAASKPNPMQEIQEALGDYIKTLDQSNSVPIGFHVASMQNFGWDPSKANLWTMESERRLRQLVTKYRETADKLETANAIVDGRSPLAKTLQKAKVQEIAAAIPLYENYMGKIAGLHKKLLGDQNPDLAKYSIPAQSELPSEDLLPMIPAPPTGSLRIAADGTPWDLPHSRTMFFVGGKGLLDAVRKLYPDTKVAQLIFYVQGKYLENLSIYFESVPIRIFAYDGSEKEARIVLQSSDNNVDFNVSLPNANEAGVHEGGGKYHITVTDRLGRSADFPLATSRWHIENSDNIHNFRYSLDWEYY